MVLSQQNLSASCWCPAKTSSGTDYSSVLAAPGESERQQGSSRKAAQERECSDTAFPLRYKAG